ncbi:MAG: tripartite tricarboxylate transporter TctB family protein [Kiloniellaceae bacterium]
MRGRRGRLLIELAFWLGLAAIAYALSFEFADAVGTYAWGAASWPRAVILLMAAGAIAQFGIRLRWQAGGGQSRAGGAAVPAGGLRRAFGISGAKLAAALGLPLVDVYLLPHAGFYVTTPFFLAAYLALLGERRPAALVGGPLLIYALINLVFTKLFYVALPTGTWPGFYDFSNWFLVMLR